MLFDIIAAKVRTTPRRVVTFFNAAGVACIGIGLLAHVDFLMGFGIALVAYGVITFVGGAASRRDRSSGR